MHQRRGCHVAGAGQCDKDSDLIGMHTKAAKGDKDNAELRLKSFRRTRSDARPLHKMFKGETGFDDRQAWMMMGQ